MLHTFSKRQIYFVKYFKRNQWVFFRRNDTWLVNLFYDSVVIFLAGTVLQMRRGGINFADRRPRPKCRRGWWRRCWQPLNNNKNDNNNNNNNNEKTTTTTTSITTIKQQQQQNTSCVRNFLTPQARCHHIERVRQSIFIIYIYE